MEQTNSSHTFIGKYSLLLFLAQVILFQVTFSQNNNIVFERLTIRNGLSHNNVYAIIQDSIGYMWFGTQDGLNRYDGKNITIFRNNPSDTNSLSTGNFGKILQDSRGIYWFGTFGGGVDRYNPNTNVIKNFSYNPNNSKSISNNQVLFIFEDSKGTIWIGTSDGGLNQYDDKTETFIRYQHNKNDSTSLSSNRAKCMCETSDGTLWIGTDKGLNRLNSSTKTFTHYKNNPFNTNSLGGNVVHNMIPESDGTIWIVLYDGGLNRFNPVTNKFTHYTHNSKDAKSISDNKVNCILKDSYNQIWIGTLEGGLNKFDPKSETFTCYKHSIYNIESISSNRIEYLFEDRSKNLWIGTRGGGINKIDLKPPKFNNLTHDPNNINSLPPQSIMSITSDSKGDVWIGSDGGGLTCFKPQNNSYTHYVNNKNNENSLSGNRVWSLLFENDSILWVGTCEGGANRMKFKNGKYQIIRFKNDPNNLESISHNQVNNIVKDSSGTIWFATANGLNKLVINDSFPKYQFKRYFYNSSNSVSFNDNYINSLVVGPNGVLWLGSYIDGLIEFNTKTEIFKKYSVDEGIPSGIKLLHIYKDSNQNLMLGTESRGILIYDFKNRSIRPHPQNNHLLNNSVISITEDNVGNLWVGSTRGLSKYSSATEQFNYYTVLDGIEGDDFNRNAAHKTANGILYFGSNAGITYINPQEASNNQIIPKIAITDINVLNHSIFENNFTPFHNFKHQQKKLILTHKENFFSIHFASFDFTNPSKNIYKYKLEGFNDDWIEINNNNSATFTNLNPGTYIFKATGSNNDEVWAETPTEITIEILPPFWKRGWFYFSEIILVIFFILLYIKLRTIRLIKEKRVLEEKVVERTIEINTQKEELETILESLKNTQDQLIQSEKMASLSILTSGIAHEINNPLNFIHGSARAIEIYVNEHLKEHSKELTPVIEVLDEGVKRVAKIVKSLNRLRIGTNAIMEVCDIHRIIDNCLLVLNDQFDNKIKVNTVYSDTTPEVLGNEGNLHQVFISILINAMHAIDHVGAITITTQVNIETVAVIITDDGCGISEENLHRLTDPFFTTKDPGMGIGLGLSIVYSILQEHNGTIQFESKQGQGTTVIITLPYNKTTRNL